MIQFIDANAQTQLKNRSTGLNAKVVPSFFPKLHMSPYELRPSSLRIAFIRGIGASSIFALWLRSPYCIGRRADCIAHRAIFTSTLFGLYRGHWLPMRTAIMLTWGWACISHRRIRFPYCAFDWVSAFKQWAFHMAFGVRSTESTLVFIQQDI